jgi:alkylation response protein AidB-like acyl-CoA dehydrogenase
MTTRTAYDQSQQCPPVREESGMSDGELAGVDVRDKLLAGIRDHRREFEAAGDRAEELRTLPADTVDTLCELRMFWLKTPQELGGTPLAPLEFCDVIEELAFVDVSTAWATMIGVGCAGMAGGWLPDGGARRVFADGSLPLIAGQPQPRGTARPVDGGYVVSGRWGFASGIAHASWVIAGFRVAGDDGRILVFIAPKERAEVIDNWHVAGLAGTGSMDFTMDEVFVPEDMTWDYTAAAVRGGDLFRQEGLLFVSNEVPPLCVGMARRALDDMTELASRTARFAGGATLSERAVFLKELGRAETRIRAARLVHRDAIEAAWEATLAGTGPSPAEHAAVAAASVYAVETCADVITGLFRYGGGRVLSLSHPMQRHLRNALAARQHVAVTEEHYEVAGRERIQSAKSRGA